MQMQCRTAGMQAAALHWLLLHHDELRYANVLCHMHALASHMLPSWLR
jgi:hypothetical protein